MKKKINFTKKKNKYNKNNITIKKLQQYGGNSDQISRDHINKILNTRILNQEDFMMTQDQYLIFCKYNRKQVLLFEKKNKNIIFTNRIKFNNIIDIINNKDNSVYCCYLLDIKNHSNHVIFDNNDNINNIFVYNIKNVPDKKGGGGNTNYTKIKYLLNNQNLPELYISKQEKIQFDIDNTDEKLKKFLSDIICDFEDINDFDKKIFINNDNYYKYNKLETLYLKYYNFIDFKSININVFKTNLIDENKKKNPDINVVKNNFYENYCKAVQNKYNIFLDNVYDEDKKNDLHSNLKTILDDSSRLGEHKYIILFELILLKVILIINIHLGGNFYSQGNSYFYKNILFYLIDNNKEFNNLKLIINFNLITSSIERNIAKNKNTYYFLDTETINYEKILFKYIISIMLYTSSNKFDKFVKNKICGKKTNVKYYYLSVDNCKNKYNNDICRLANYTILLTHSYTNKFLYDKYAINIRTSLEKNIISNEERKKFYYFYYFHDRFNYYIEKKGYNNISNILTHIIKNYNETDFALFYGVPSLVLHISNVKEFLNIVVDNNLKALIDLCICYFIHRLKNINIEDDEFSLKIDKINLNAHYNNVHGSFIDTLNKHQHAHIISMYYDLKETCLNIGTI